MGDVGALGDGAPDLVLGGDRLAIDRIDAGVEVVPDLGDKPVLHQPGDLGSGGASITRQGCHIIHGEGTSLGKGDIFFHRQLFIICVKIFIY